MADKFSQPFVNPAEINFHVAQIQNLKNELKKVALKLHAEKTRYTNLVKNAEASQEQ